MSWVYQGMKLNVKTWRCGDYRIRFEGGLYCLYKHGIKSGSYKRLADAKRRPATDEAMLDVLFRRR